MGIAEISLAALNVFPFLAATWTSLPLSLMAATGVLKAYENLPVAQASLKKLMAKLDCPPLNLYLMRYSMQYSYE